MRETECSESPASGRQEAGRREEEERFRRFVDTASDAIVSFDADGRIRFWNSAAVTTFGYSVDEAVGEKVWVLMDEDGGRLVAESMEALVRRGLAVGDGASLCLSGRRRDGTALPMELSLSGWEQDGAALFNAIVRDNTERAVAEQALETLSRRHELLLNSAGEGIVGLDPDGTVSFANPAALALLGLDAGELLGGTIRSILCPRSGPSERDSEAVSQVLSSLRNGACFHGEVELRKRDGSSFFAASSCTPILEGGSVAGGVMIFEDITARRRQEEALRNSEAAYRSLVARAPYGIFRSTEEGSFLSLNPALVEMLGYGSEEELLDLGRANTVYEDPADLRRILGAWKDRRRIVGMEMKWRRKDGTPLWVRISGRLVREEGTGIFEGFVEDLSERRALEEQLRQAQKMEAVGQLTGGIAHDFNNFLAVILLNSELIRASLDAGEPVEAADVEAIHTAAKRASSITRKLLGFSRRADLSLTPLQLGEVVEGLHPMLRTLLPENVRLKLEIVAPDAMVLADAGSLEQILLNLVTNSRDALPQGGEVSVRVVEEEVDETYCLFHPGMKPGRYACLEVGDTGTGMNADTLSRIFDPFFTTKDPAAGTGLGMAMVYGLTRQQGGQVKVYSELGEGTLTRLYFPFHEGAEVREVATRQEGRGWTGSATVLLVEDEESVRAAAALALRRSGFTVLTATEGAEALEIYAAYGEEIDLVFSDLVLPRMSGLELREELNAQYGPVRFILTSGYSGDHLANAGGLDPAVPFVRKPWTLNELLGTVRHVLETDPPRWVAARSPTE